MGPNPKAPGFAGGYLLLDARPSEIASELSDGAFTGSDMILCADKPAD